MGHLKSLELPEDDDEEGADEQSEVDSKEEEKVPETS